MILKTISLTNFRNYPSRVFHFSSQITLIVGPNTAGKTNLLEAVNLLSTGRSLHGLRESDLISWDAEWGRVEGDLVENGGRGMVGDFSVNDVDERRRMEIFLERREDGGSSKQLKIAGVTKSLQNFQSSFPVVLFSPESIQLLLGSPSRRRGFLDKLLTFLDVDYSHFHGEYHKVVRQRNQILWAIKERHAAQERLRFWNRKLFDLGDKIYRRRKRLIKLLNEELLALDIDVLLSYEPRKLERPLYEERLSKEIERTTTLWGTHRDDFHFVKARINADKSVSEHENDLSIFGSRGEQREAVFALFIAEMEVLSRGEGEQPLLLLDDIFSELDRVHREKVISVLSGKQSLITSAEPELLNSHLVENARVIKLS